MKRYLLFFVFLSVAAFVFAAPLKVAFIYVDPIGQTGWTYAQDLGRIHVQKVLGNEVKTTYIANVPDGAEVINVLKELANQGYNLIYTTSFSYMEQTAQVAKEFPNTIFENCSGYLTGKNLGNYFGRIYQSEFLTGLVAGAMSKSDKIGYVAAFPTPEVVRGINAFAIGARMVNPHAEVHVVWVNSWYDPPTEKEAALSLINAGCDVIKSETDSPAPLQAAEEKGAYAIGYNTDMQKYAPKYYLTSATFNWGNYFVKDIESVMNGTWKSRNFWGGLDSGMVGIAPLSNLVPAQTQRLVKTMETAIKDRKFDVFSGPIYAQNGKLMIKDGETAADETLLSMNWFVKGVIGTIPK